MKAINLLFFFSVFMGCYNQFSQDSTAGQSKQCRILTVFSDCLFNTEDPKCFEVVPMIGFIGTRHDSLINSLLDKKITPADFMDSVSKKEAQAVALTFYENHREFIDKDSLADTLINLRQHYSCS